MNKKKREQKLRRLRSKEKHPFTMDAYLHQMFGDHRTEDEVIVDNVLETPRFEDVFFKESPLMAKLRRG